MVAVFITHHDFNSSSNADAAKASAPPRLGLCSGHRHRCGSSPRVSSRAKPLQPWPRRGPRR